MTKLTAGLSLIAAIIVLGRDCALAKNPPKRPRILGIASVTLLSSDIPATLDYYGHIAIYRPRTCDLCKERPSPVIALTPYQTIKLKNIPSQATSSLVDEVIFRSEDLDTFAKYLAARNVKFTADQFQGSIGRISLEDPEGHHIALVGQIKPLTTMADIGSQEPKPFTVKLIHAGFVVRDRAATDHFYRDILGFRPYWRGGMKDDKDDWVAMQVPDGTDWIEYMLNIPLDADKKLLGVMNHIAFGVTDIQATKAQLLKNGATLTEEPKLGRDGKWQLNLYDPDDTRVEFMEFTPKEKPCCSEFTGPHPGPHQ